MNKNLFCKVTLADVFIIFMVITTLFFLIANILLKGQLLIYDPYHDHLMAVDTMIDKSNYPNILAVFPPLAYVFYDMVLLSGSNIPNNKNLFFGLDSDNISILLQKYHIYFLISLFIFIMYLILMIEIFKNISADNKKKYWLSTSIVFSFPILNAFHTGNSVFITSLFILIAVYIFNLENLRRMENMYIYGGGLTLAIASNFKFYPAIFGLILLKRKKYKMAFFTIFAGLMLFIVPFFYFDGINTLSNLILILRRFDSGNNFVKTNIYGILNQITTKFFHYNMTINIHKLIRMFLIFVSICGFVLSKRFWKELFFLGYFCCICMINGYNYNYIYIIPSIIYFFVEENCKVTNIRENPIILTVYVAYMLFMSNLPGGGGLHVIFIHLLFVILSFEILLYYFRRKKI